MKKETWKFIIQTIVAILTAILTTLGVTSCMGGFHHRSPDRHHDHELHGTRPILKNFLPYLLTCVELLEHSA